MNQDFNSAPAPAPLPEAPKSNNNTLFIILGVIVVLCCCCLLAAAGVYFYQNGDQIFGTGAMQPLLSLL